MQALDQLADGWHKAVGIERVGAEHEGVVAGKHEVLVDVTTMGDVLQSFLDAVRSRIGLPVSRAVFELRPVGEITS